MTWSEFRAERRRLEKEPFPETIFNTFQLALRRNLFLEAQARRILELSRKVEGGYGEQVRKLMERRISRLQTSRARLESLAKKEDLPKT